MLRRICRCKSCGEDGRTVTSNEYGKHHVSSHPHYNLSSLVLTVICQRAMQMSGKYAKRVTTLEQAEILPPLTTTDFESRYGHAAPSSRHASSPTIRITSSSLKSLVAEVVKPRFRSAVPGQSQVSVATLRTNQPSLVRGDVDIYDTCK